ncbi:hypothetical protein AGOR_G00152550 [Albula goreensis]|uniref:H15 domain-containing protein n=1 Tax=Albula goreensis TaxID=1534307 RepID=A0A8T3CYC5_9TELE|nr:hypothetical protein AGOR_G00152550 [Albula goreensis]
MPPKKAASIEVTSPEKPSSDAPKKGEKPSERANMGSAEPEKAAAPRKMPSHPSTMDMVKEALKELDTRKGSSAQAIRGYILEKYPSVDAVRLKYMLRKALAKGLEGGTLMRPANSTGNGAQGRFRLAVRSKAKEQKAKGTENADPNAEKPSPKKTKTKAKTKTKSKGTDKPKPAGKKLTAEDLSPTSPPQEAPPSKVAPAKKPKKPAVAKEAPANPKEGAGPKGRKPKAPASQPEEEGGAAAKNPGKRGKKTAA